MPWRETLQRLNIHLRQLRHPTGLQAGSGSFVRTPFYIPSGDGIVLGTRSRIGCNATISLIKRYGNQTFNPKILIGDDVYVGTHVYLAATGEINIGDGCVLSDYVNINDTSHGMDPTAGNIMQQNLVSKGPIRLEPNCFVGYRAAILPGVTLGRGCVVGINSVVTKSFPPYCMIAGAPARVIRVFNFDIKSWVWVSTNDSSS